MRVGAGRQWTAAAARARADGYCACVPSSSADTRVSIAEIAREWGRIGITGFGGPPAHIALLRRLCVQRNQWLAESEFEDGIAATSLLPGPASTQLAIFCAWRLAGVLGALVGGVCFIVPGLIIILGLSVLFLAHSPPAWVTGAAAGAGAAVPAVALGAAAGLIPASWRRAGPDPSAAGRDAASASLDPSAAGRDAASASLDPSAAAREAGGSHSAHRLAALRQRLGPVSGARIRWICYLLAGAVAANLAGELLVAVLLGCGVLECLISRAPVAGVGPRVLLPVAAKAGLTTGVLGSIAWVAVKVGALSFGGGFVIIPLMQHDAVHTYHWMTTAQFLSAVALGQVTPGPVVQTVAVVGYAAAGLTGGLLAAVFAFAPSFAFVLAGGPHFDRFRRSAVARAFLNGAGPAAIGAIAGAAITLGLGLTHAWQVVLLAAAIIWLLVLRRGVVSAILGAAGIGMLVALAGGLS
jgi:chromate transporter